MTTKAAIVLGTLMAAAPAVASTVPVSGRPALATGATVLTVVTTAADGADATPASTPLAGQLGAFTASTTLSVTGSDLVVPGDEGEIGPWDVLLLPGAPGGPGATLGGSTTIDWPISIEGAKDDGGGETVVVLPLPGAGLMGAAGLGVIAATSRRRRF